MFSTRDSSPRLLPLLLAAVLLLPGTAQPAGQNKIVYDSFDWSIYTSTHFDVYYYSREKDALQKVVSMAESSYDELSRRLNYQIPKRIPIIYFATHAEFEQNNIILNFIPEGVGAFAEPARNRMVLPIDMPDEKLQTLVQHELTHIFQYEVLYGGRLTRALTSTAPTWLIEGMASYYASDEDEKDRMFLRDAVSADQIPAITKVQIEGYTAYRYGHAVFDFMEAEWGKDAVRDFVYEYRSFGGRDIRVALKRTFEVEPDDFDLKFRRYLRRKYLPLLAVKGEASEYGERFRVGKYDRPSYEIGAAPSPSGDFIATLTSVSGDDIDIGLLSVKGRKLYKNLSVGKTTKYEYLVAQYMTTAPESGRDLSFAPDGDRIAVFARHERGRKLAIFSAKGGGLLERIPVAPDMPLAPAWSPDGDTVIFSATENNQRDIFALDLTTRTVRNLTDDPAYDSAPVYSPDGQYIYHGKIVGGLSKIVRFKVSAPTSPEQITWGEGNDEDPSLSLDGKRLYFSSSRGGIFNIYGQELATGEISQYTDVIGAALGPAAFNGPDGQEKIAFSGFQAQRFQLYLADAKKPIKKLDEKALPPAAIKTGGTAGFVPSVEVAIDPEKNRRPKFKLFLENAQVLAGINTDQTFTSLVQLSFSDYLGNRRAFFVFDSVSTVSNFRIGYYNLKNRFQWGAEAYDTRYFFYGQNQFGELTRDQRFSRTTGVQVSGFQPLSRQTRIEGSIGYISRKIDFPTIITNSDGTQGQIFDSRSDNVPTAGVAFSYDATRFREFGPHGGRRLDLSYQYTPNLTDASTAGRTLSSDWVADARMYVPISSRTLFAFRAFGARSTGAYPNVYAFGGLDDLRGVDFRTRIGNSIFYFDTEFRFPLVDVIATPILGVIQGIRGRIFLNVGGAWLRDESFQFWDGNTNRLKDGLSTYGAGFTVYFLGLPWNFDFSRQWDFRTNLSETRTTFYIGSTF